MHTRMLAVTSVRKLTFLLLFHGLLVGCSAGHSPEFNRPIPNLSIVSGKDAFLRCSISNLGDNKVLWTHVDSQQLISIQEHVITDKEGRISIEIVGDTFELRINNISLADRGYYMCAIQCLDSSVQCTPKSQVGFLNVVVPPRFDETVLQSESNVTVREFDDVNIPCSASGNPKPTIYWKREDFYLSEHNVHANRLHIASVSRQDAGTYICGASNGVQPSISRRINLVVHFAPMIRLVTQVLPAYVGDSVKLECQTESNPLAEHIWQFPNGDRISSLGATISTSNAAHRKRHRLHGGRQSDERRNQSLPNRKYQVSLKKNIQYRYLFQLHVHHVTHEDAGQFQCAAWNRMGEARSTILLKVNERPRKQTNKETTKSTTKSTTRIIDYDLGNEIQLIHKPANKVGRNEEDNHIPITRLSTQLLKANKSKNSCASFGLSRLLFATVFLVVLLAVL